MDGGRKRRGVAHDLLFQLYTPGFASFQLAIYLFNVMFFVLCIVVVVPRTYIHLLSRTS